MCGWVVVVGLHGQAVAAQTLRAATAVLVHRGPDDAGEFFSGAVAMGFRRLAIIDLSPAGHQPMTSADGHLTLVFNGEIYNYQELRAELRAAGHAFRSDSDTEVLLTAFIEWGRDCVQRFNGMFAFLIHDRRDGSLFGARDRLGVKPMYVWQDADWLMLASEPGAVGASGLGRLQPDWNRLADALRRDWMDHANGSCLVGVRQVPAAHRVQIVSGGVVREDRYWALPDEPRPPSTASDAQWIDELSALAADAVRLRLRSDVPVGFTLSGGIDSSLLICEAAHQGSRDLVAFSYQDRVFDERQAIADTVAQVGARMHVIDESKLDVAALLPHVVAANGEPVHSLSAVANYALFGLARQQGVKVLLGGQGADELFGGYYSFQQDYWRTLWGDGEWAALLADIRGSAVVHGHGVARVLGSTAIRSMLLGLSRTAVYQRLRSALPRLAEERKALRQSVFSPEFLRRHPGTPPVVGAGLRLGQSQRFSLTYAALPMYLRSEDRVSMAHSVEARLPFTDYRLVEHAMRLPDRLKFVNGVNKVALRRVAARRVPASVTSRITKLGFPVGHSDATAAGLNTLCRELAGTRAFRERGIYELAAVEKLLSRPARAADVGQLFDLAQTEIWLNGIGQPTLKAPA